MIWICIPERMTAFRIPHYSLHTRFQGKTQWLTKLHCIDNIIKNITSLGFTLRSAGDNGGHLFVPIHVSPPNGLDQELVVVVVVMMMMTMMMMMMTTTTTTMMMNVNYL